MSEKPPPRPGAFEPGNPHRFLPGVGGGGKGRAKKPDDLPDAAEVSYRWLKHVAAGTDGMYSRAAMRTALKEAFDLGRGMPDDMPQERIDEDLEALFEKHFAGVMVARSTEKVDVPRVKVCIDLMDRHYGKATQSINVDARGEFVARVVREIVDPAPPSHPSPETKKLS